jgi:hypothetical protein
MWGELDDGGSPALIMIPLGRTVEIEQRNPKQLMDYLSAE